MIVRISDDALALACGADAVAEAFAKKGHEVHRVSSWGMHWLEPLVEVNGVGWGPVTTDRVDEICDGGADDICIGPVAAHPFIARQQRLTFARAGKTRPTSVDDYEVTGGWEAWKRVRTMDPMDVIKEVTESGLRGRGGAGFPAGIKWKTVADAKNPRKYVVVNADEGDSGTFADRMLMEGDPFQLIEGMAIAAYAVGAQTAYIYTRSEYPHAIAKMEEAIRHAAPIISPLHMEVRMGAGAYVCGEETSLLNSLEGKRGEVRAKPPLPALEGFMGCPTVVNNVLTIAAIPHIMAEGGAEEYARLGIDRSKGTMPIQLAGNIKHGGLYEIAFGITLGELVNDIGGGTQSGRPVKATARLGKAGEPCLLHLRFLEDHVLARDRIELPQFQLFGHGARVLLGHVEVARVRGAHHLDQLRGWLGHIRCPLPELIEVAGKILCPGRLSSPAPPDDPARNDLGI